MERNTEQEEETGRRSEDELQRLARRLSGHSPLRLYWPHHVSRPAISTTDLLSLLKRIKTSAWREQAIAYYLLAQMELPSEQRNSVARMSCRPLLRPEYFGGSGRDYVRAIGYLYLGWVASLSAGILLLELPSHIAWMLPSVFWIGAFPTLLMAPFVGWSIWMLHRHRRRIVQRAAATALATHGDPHCISVLSDYVYRASPIRHEAIAALLAILPTVTKRWADRLTSRSHAALLDLITHPQEELALAALDALENVGPGTAAPAVQRLAKRARSEQIRMRAAAVLPTLLGRATHAREASTLLRPSADNKTEHLLRPIPQHDPDTSHLLRASQGENGCA